MLRRTFFIILSLVVFSSCYNQDGDELPHPEIVGPVTQDDNIALGNPSGAVPSILSSDNYLMVKKQYALSYNNTKRTANWVSWHLSKAWIGSITRQDDFRADAALPSSWVTVDSYDYSGSGFDRGHLCPSADRTLAVEDNSATFLMTNMMPQAPQNNQVPWANFENYCRTLTGKGYELYIIAGPSGKGGVGSKGYVEAVGSKSITVPKYTWKVVLVLPTGNNDINRISEKTRIIAVWMPNTQDAASKPWYNYRVSVDYIESMTGYDFYSNVSAEIQNIIEARVDDEAI